MKGVIIIKRENYIKAKIKELGFNVKEFAEYIDMPYSTLRSILNQSIGGAAIDNVLKICSGLNISVEELQAQLPTSTPPDDSVQPADEFTSHERKVISAYREHPDMQKSVDKLLGVGSEPNASDDIKKIMNDTETAEVMAYQRNIKS